MAKKQTKNLDRRELNPVAIRVLRAYEGLTQEGLASLFDVTPETIRNWEHGKSDPSGRVVDRIWRGYIIGKGYPLELYKERS